MIELPPQNVYKPFELPQAINIEKDLPIFNKDRQVDLPIFNKDRQLDLPIFNKDRQVDL